MVSKKLLKIQPIAEVYRTPESLKEIANWKAADWLYWTLYYAIPCLRGIVDNKLFKCFVLFNKFLTFLLGSEIDKSQLGNCEREILQFQQGIQDAFGQKSMTSNLHSLSHLVTSLKKNGPLWAVSAFLYEGNFARVKNNVSGPKGVDDQIADWTLEYYEHRTKVLLANDPNDPVSVFCTNLLYNNRNLPVTNVLNFESGARLYYSSDKEIQENVFHRCHYNDFSLHSVSYKEQHLSDNTVIQLNDGQIGEIEFFFVRNDKAFMKIRVYDVELFKFENITLNHMFMVKEKGDLIDVEISNLKIKLVHVYISEAENYVSIPVTLLDVR